MNTDEKLKSYGLGIILFFIFSIYSFGQTDSHYWTHQYGAKGLLLNGAVIASADDETNIYYNPGALGLDEDLGFAFSFLSPSYASLMANNFLGDGRSLTDNGFDLTPGFLAVRFKAFGSEKLTFGFTSFERFKSNIHFKDRVVNNINESSLFLLKADINFRRKISEDWFGFGISYNITDRLGIGVSQFSSWHSQDLDLFLKKEITVSPTPEQVGASWRSEFNYGISTYSGWITKLGISYTGENFKLGMTYTSPTYGILGSGVSYALDDQRFIQANNEISVVSNRNDVEILNFKSPASVGFGFEVHDDKISYSFSGEYFNAIEQYTIFSDTDDAFDGLASGQSETEINVKTGNESVFNFAIGLQVKKNETTSFIGGFRTDFNENTSLLLNDSAEYLGSTPDVFHISGGAMIRKDKNIFSIGLDLGYGNSKGGAQLANFDDVSIDNLFSLSGNRNVDTNYYTFTLFLTYDFIFKRIPTTDAD